MYSVLRNTLYRRINRQTSREDYIPTNKRLSLIKEEVIVKNICNDRFSGHVSQGAISHAIAESIPHDAFPHIRDIPVTEVKQQRSVFASPASLIAG
jgi:hypothetical protein